MPLVSFALNERAVFHGRFADAEPAQVDVAPGLPRAGDATGSLGERCSAHRAGAHRPRADDQRLGGGRLVADEQHHVALGIAHSPVKGQQFAVPVEEGIEPAATARAGLGVDAHLAGEGLAVVGRLGHVNAPGIFAMPGVQRRGVPDDLDVAAGVGNHCAAAVERAGVGHEIAFRLEAVAVLFQPRVKHRRAVAVFARLVRAVPRDVHAAGLAKRESGTPDGAHRHRAAGGLVDPQRLGELGLAGLAPRVKNVRATGVAGEVNQVQRAFVIEYGLGLDTVGGHAGEAHGGLRRRDGPSGSGHDASNQDRQSAQFHGGKAYQRTAAKQCPARDLS